MSQRALPHLARAAVEVCLMALVYMAISALAQRLTAPGWVACPVWPATGVAWAITFMRGYRVLPGVFLGMMLGFYLHYGDIQAHHWSISLGNTGEAFLGVYLMRRYCATCNPFDRIDLLYRFVLFVCVISTLVSAGVGNVSLYMVNYLPAEGFLTSFWVWWFSNLSGGLIFGPLLLLTANAVREKTWFRGRNALSSRGLVLMGLTAISTWILFLHVDQVVLRGYHPEYLLIPLMIASAYLAGRLGTAWLTFAIFVISVMGTLSGTGPFASSNPNDSFLSLQTFLFTYGLVSLFLSVSVSQQRAAQRGLEAAQQRLRELNAGLEQQVRDRTAELTERNEELHQARDRAERASHIRERFLAQMSHELRTPLNGVIGIAELLTFTNLDSEQKEQVAVLRRSSDILLKLVNQVLHFSKIESGHESCVDTACNPARLIREIIGIVTPQAEEHGVQIVLHLGTDLPESIRLDSDKLRQILLNLLGNAVKFTPRGGTVTVSARLSPQLVPPRKTSSGSIPIAQSQPAEPLGEEGMLEVAVKDTGVGIPNENLAAIFDPFIQLGEARNKPVKGTGLGLPITQRLVTLMEGSLTAHSEVNVGSEFTVTLPFRPSTGPEEPSSNPPMSLPQLPDGQLPGLLLAEDNEVNILVAVNMLKTLGHTCDVARTGREAVNLAASGKYRLVFMDVQMPEMDGVEATHELRQLQEQGKVPRMVIIGLTANAMEGDRQRLLDEGMDDYLSKPVRLKDFQRVIEQWLEGEHADGTMN